MRLALPFAVILAWPLAAVAGTAHLLDVPAAAAAAALAPLLADPCTLAVLAIPGALIGAACARRPS